MLDGQVTDDTNFEGGSLNPQDGMQSGEQQPTFEIPEEYLQKDWVKNFEGQSGDDLKAGIFKALDEKYSNLPEIPENADGYSFNDILKDEDYHLVGWSRNSSLESKSMNFESCCLMAS